MSAMTMSPFAGLRLLRRWGMLYLALAAHAVLAPAQTSVGTAFPIASNWMSVGAAFDGTNYLIGLQSNTLTASVAAQLVSPAGAKVGPVIALGRSGQSCCNSVAFDGTNYLMVWEDNQGIQNSPSPFLVQGQFISTAGAALAQPFAISTSGIWMDGLNSVAYGGGKYLVTYSRLVAPASGGSPGNRYVAGRIVSPDGTMGSELRISTGAGAMSGIGFDGSNFFVAWIEDSRRTEVRARFVSPSGSLGQEISVNASAAVSDNPPVLAFDGTNYLVVFHDEVAGAAVPYPRDVFGQRVSPAGALVGGVITISNDPGTQWAAGIAFDGSNYLVSWTDMQNATNWDVYGRYVGKDGVLVGSRFTINSDAGNQIGGVAGYGGGKYLLLINNGMQMGPNGPTQVGQVSGAFAGAYQPAPPNPDQPIAPPPVEQVAYAVPSGRIPATAMEVSATGTYASASLRVALDIADVLRAVPATGFAAATYNVYVAALVPAAVLGLTNATWFVKPRAPANWSVLQFPIAAYLENALQAAVNDTVVIDILTNTDVRSLIGTEIYVGFGTSDTEMLAAGRYRGVYKLR